MALHNNLRLFFLFCSLLIPLRLGRPEISPSLHPESSPQSAPISSSSSAPSSTLGPESVLSPSPGPAPGPAFTTTPSPGPAPRPAPIQSPSPGPASVPTPSPGPAPGPLGPAPGPSPFPGPAPGPSPFSGPAPGPSPFPGPAPGPSPFSGPAPGPSPFSGPVPGLLPSLGPAQGPSRSSEPAPGPSPSMSDAPTESDGPFQFDFSPSLAPSVDVDPKVKEICDSTDHPSLCLAAVVPLLNGKTDLSSVLNAAIRAGARISRYGLFLAQKLTGEPGTPPELASVLEDCKRSYSTAVDNYENAIDAFPERDIGTMNSMLSAVITNVGDCEDALSKQGPDSPFSSVAGRLRNMTSNCLAIVSLLD